LDPATYRYLNEEDLREAERLILAEFNIYQSLHRLRIGTLITTANSMSMPTSTQDQVVQNNTTSQEISSLDEFFRMCEMPLSSNLTTPSTKKPLTFKEELCHFMATAGSCSTLSQYWCQHEEILPQLSQFVKRFNCIPAISVPCEAAFSIAGHVQRKARSSLSPTALRYSMVLRE
jgi:hypothetical protein